MEEKMELNNSYEKNVSVNTTINSITEAEQAQLVVLVYWLNGIAANVIIAFGLIGNVLTIIVLSRRAMRSSTNYYLASLAIWDCIVLIGTALLISIPILESMDWYKKTIHAYVVCYIYPLALSAQTATIWITVSFTVERYIAVCHPLQAASMCTIYRAKVLVILVSLVSIIYNVPRWFENYIVYGSNNTVLHNTTSLGDNTNYKLIYYSWMYVPIMCIVPLIVLSVLNAFLIQAVRRSQQQRRDMNVRQSRENNITIMLVSVVIVFIICQVPALVYNAVFSIDNTIVYKQYSYLVLSEVRNMLVTLNSAVNFVLYCALGQKFRRVFLHTFCSRCTKDAYLPVVSTATKYATHPGPAPSPHTSESTGKGSTTILCSPATSSFPRTSSQRSPASADDNPNFIIKYPRGGKRKRQQPSQTTSQTYLSDEHLDATYNETMPLKSWREITAPDCVCSLHRTTKK